MKIVSCGDAHGAAWNAFVAAAPGGSLYHRFEWREINRRSFGHRSAYLAATDGDRVVGVFPLVQVKSQLFGNIACSLPFVNYGGPCAEHPEVERALIDAAGAVAAEWGAEYVEIRARRSLGDQFPTSTHKVSMTVDLEPDPEALFGRFHRTHRRDIRKAQSYGFEARFGGVDLVDDFYAVLSESWRDLGTPIYRKSYLERVLRTFPNETYVTVVYLGDELAAAALTGQHAGVAEGLWLGIRNRFRQQMSGYVLYWELIRDACTRGWTRFHLGRSTAGSGSEVFKRKWNAYPVQLYWQYILRTRRDIPQLNVDNPKYRLAIGAWQRLPVPVTQVVGPLIACSIP